MKLQAFPPLPRSLGGRLPATLKRADRWLAAAHRSGALSRRRYADLPREVLNKWRAGEPRDALWLLRKQLIQEWLPPLLEARGASDVANLSIANVPRGVRDLFLEVHGLRGVSTWDRRPTARLTTQLEDLARELELSRLL